MAYIRKKNRGFAEQLAYKKYCKTRIAELEKEREAIDKYLKTMSTISHPTSDELFTLPEYSTLIIPVLPNKKYKYKDWAEEPYEKNSYYADKLTVPTVIGKNVRSKSEATICSVLYRNNIAFRYECALYIGDKVVYPDFTIKHPKTGEIFYWEHLGMMDDPQYVEGAFRKLKLMADNGIVIEINLIITSETLNHPLSEETVNEKVLQYFS